MQSCPLLRHRRGRYDVGVRIAEVHIDRADGEHPRTPEQIGAKHALGGRYRRQAVGMPDDRAGSSDVLAEVLERGLWHGGSLLARLATSVG
jgi:hypothetical protein